MSAAPGTAITTDDAVESNAPELPAQAIPPRASSKRHNLKHMFDSSKAPDLSGIVDLTDSVDTTVHTTELPAVVHETIKPYEHHIREEYITRDIHEHDVYHRVLPIQDVEVLPAKHFVQNADGSLKEVPASAVPGRNLHWHVTPCAEPHSHDEASISLEEAAMRPSQPIDLEALNASMVHDPVAVSHREIQSLDGVQRTETEWHHHPEIMSPDKYALSTSSSSGAGSDRSSGTSSLRDEPPHEDTDKGQRKVQDEHHIEKTALAQDAVNALSGNSRTQVPQEEAPLESGPTTRLAKVPAQGYGYDLIRPRTPPQIGTTPLKGEEHRRNESLDKPSAWSPNSRHTRVSLDSHRTPTSRSLDSRSSDFRRRMSTKIRDRFNNWPGSRNEVEDMERRMDQMNVKDIHKYAGT